MRDKSVVVVESPAKAKTINRYLGPDYTVLASFGHVRDLSPKEGSVRPAEDFDMTWEVDSKASKRIKDITDALKSADRLVLATDPDREGEAISWHLLEILKAKRGLLKDKQVQRITFNAITKSSVLEAMDNPRDLDQPLVEAYLARRALDYLVGYSLSPVLWRKLPGSRSAGRVQSVALRLICDRESEIEAFKSDEYWTLAADLNPGEKTQVRARLVAVADQKLEKLSIGNEEAALALKARLASSSYQVQTVESKPAKRNPAAPFTTSTLQQEASRKLRFGSGKTMQVAQRLYEGIDLGGETTGLITYMRTDGVDMAPEAIAALRDEIKSEFGEAYLPNSPRVYKTKAKNAQEAHEAIRPTDIRRHPDSLKSRLDPEQLKLYDLIWRRSLAAQMEAAVFERTTVEIDAKDKEGTLGLRVSGQVLKFPGFLKLYREDIDDEAEGADDDRILPPMTKGQTLSLKEVLADQHFTEPPPRYSEASLIRSMEEIGIGRPSTYTATLTTLKDRGYVVADKGRMLPEDKGRLVTAFLSNFFARYVEFGFTASLEEKLDEISRGDAEWKKVMEEFWLGFSGAIDKAKELDITQVIDKLNEVLADLVFPPREDGQNPRVCTLCGEGNLSLKLGRYGSFVGCSNYPECRFTRPLGKGEDGGGAAQAENRELGLDPDSGEMVTVRQGRFGPYFQLGEGPKPKRANIGKSLDWMTVDLETALRYINLPREVGLHPETGAMISAAIGRYGPYVVHQGAYGNLESESDVFTIGLNHAVTILANKAAGRRGTPAKALKELGAHPSEGGEITVRDGRYGPYVNHGKVNASLPRGQDPEQVTVPMALELLAARIEAMGNKAPKKKAAPKKKPAKKAAPKASKTSKSS